MRRETSLFLLRPFKGGTFLWIIYVFFLSCVCYAFVCVCLFVPCGRLLGKGWPLGSRLWCLTVSLSRSHWYPGTGVLLDCIDSWSLHPYLLSLWRSPLSFRQLFLLDLAQNCSMFCCAILCVHSSLVIILMGKRALVALLSLSSWCLLIVVWLFLMVPWAVYSLWLWYFIDILTYYFV